MTMPAFASKGTASSAPLDACAGTAIPTPTLPAVINADDVLVLVVRATAQTSVDTVTVDTANGTWSTLYTNGIGTATFVGVYYLVATGSEDSAGQNVTVAMTGLIGNAFAQVYRFTGSGAGLIDTSSGGANSGSSTTPSFTAVTTTLANQLAVGMLTAGVSTTVGSVTGESGGDWTEAAAEDTDASTKTLQCQTAAMASAGTITGGTCTLGITGAWRTFSFALKEKATPKAMPVFSRPLRFAPRRARSF